MAKGAGTNRDWHRDNRCEGEFELILDAFPGEEEVLAELNDANTDKVGARFRAPDCVIEWGMRQIVGHRVGYRSVAARITYEMNRIGLPGISYSQLNKRGAGLNIHKGTTDVTDARVMAFGTGAKPRPGPITVAVDSTGLSPDRPSGWRVYHWNQESVRGWYKLHAIVNIDTSEILAYVVSEPYMNDSLAFWRLIDMVLEQGHEVGCVLADAAYDSKDYWNGMEERGIEFIANICGCLDPRKRGFGGYRKKGCWSRAKHVRRILEVGREKWKEEVGYSRRWKIEAAFSDLKRKFGDTLRARGREQVANMIGWFVIVFNLFKATRWSM